MKSKKILIEAFIGLLILISFGCNSAPALSASTSHAGMDLDTAIRETATQMETRIPSGTMVAMVSVASPSTAFSTQVLTRLESAIVSNGKLVVVDRANLDKVRAEQGFQLSGEVDDESAKSIGKLLGAGAIVTGSLTDLGDVYSLTLKAINMETATVAVSYLADLTKTTRIETLLANRDGAVISSPGGTTTIRTQQAAPVAPVRYTVTFNPNGASGTIPSAQTVQRGEKVTIFDQGTLVKVAGIFNGWNTSSNGSGTSYKAGDSIEVTSNVLLYAQWTHDANYVYKIGDTGPAGGIVFYDKGKNDGGWRYLEAAPASTEKNSFWNTEKFPIDLIKDVRSIGEGKSNTAFIMRSANAIGGGFDWAAEICNSLIVNGYNDWFLPSRDELNQMWGNLQRNGMGNFKAEWYWSSTPTIYSWNWTNYEGAWRQNFANGEQSDGKRYGSNYGDKLRIRAIRQF